MGAQLVGGGFLVAYAQVCALYYAAAGLLHVVVPAVVSVKSVQAEARKEGSVQRDALYSLGPLAVKAAVWTLVEWMHAHGWGQLYDGPIASPWHVAYCLLVIGVLDYLHDAWFYATHRLLHWRPLYRHVHYIHHKSKQPSAFTGYSFHLAEAALVFANEVLVCFLFPIHHGLHRGYHLFTTLIHQGGHVGYEVAPLIPTLAGLVSLMVRGPGRAPPSGFNTVRHHDMHHRHPRVHFSLYFTHWDRWLGTLHPGYDADVAEHFGEGSKSKPTGAHAAAPELLHVPSAGSTSGTSPRST
ncbi:hypothetical protein FOA52_007491 [Chlamydomonas sp. UWO 241]|nr:hypothetical protein FOA52_007491 [Chlamydomonas sp. UWO 241]